MWRQSIRPSTTNTFCLVRDVPSVTRRERCAILRKLLENKLDYYCGCFFLFFFLVLIFHELHGCNTYSNTGSLKPLFETSMLELYVISYKQNHKTINPDSFLEAFPFVWLATVRFIPPPRCFHAFRRVEDAETPLFSEMLDTGHGHLTFSRRNIFQSRDLSSRLNLIDRVLKHEVSFRSSGHQKIVDIRTRVLHISCLSIQCNQCYLRGFIKKRKEQLLQWNDTLIRKFLIKNVRFDDRQWHYEEYLQDARLKFLFFYFLPASYWGEICSQNVNAFQKGHREHSKLMEFDLVENHACPVDSEKINIYLLRDFTWNYWETLQVVWSEEEMRMSTWSWHGNGEGHPDDTAIAEQ